jgi:CO dehydrogenase/acetyl-CoA synthase gamma subunit (corrinoid Fe-S protein)
MAMVYEGFTPARLAQVMEEDVPESRVKHRHMIAPGLAAPPAADFAIATNWEVEVGPVCAVGLPLVLGDRWLLSGG